MKPTAKIFYLFAILNFLLLVPDCTVHADKMETNITVFFKTYTGIFSGNIEKELPSGEGTFVCPDDDAEFTVNGTWKNGLLNGNAIIQYNNGAKLEVKYKSGLISGKVTDYSADGSYRVYFCTKGRPSGIIACYNVDGSLLEYDYFYQMQPISSLKMLCSESDYNLLLNPTTYANPVKINCSVVGVYDNNTSAYILTTDSSGHYYILTYKNSATNKFNQAIVPNLSVGDKINAYGFCLMQSSLSEIAQLGIATIVNDSAITKKNPSLCQFDIYGNSTLPFIRLFAADTSSSNVFDRTNPSYEYEEIIRNPFSYSGLNCKLTGKISNAFINYSEQKMTIYLCESETENEYVLTYSFSEEDTLPAIGNVVSVVGIYSGNAKQKIEDEEFSHYVIFPMIEASSISIIQ